MILDIIVIGLVVLSFIISAKKGFVKSVWKIAALVITIALVMALKTPSVEFLAKTNVADTVYDFISERLTVDTESLNGNELTAESNMGIPQIVASQITETAGESINRGTDALTRQLTVFALNIIASVGLFIVIRVGLMIVFQVLDGASWLPVINQANAFLGGVLGAINMLALIYIACALLSLFSADSEVVGLINQSTIVKYFYNYNILLQLILKV